MFKLWYNFPATQIRVHGKIPKRYASLDMITSAQRPSCSKGNGAQHQVHRFHKY